MDSKQEPEKIYPSVYEPKKNNGRDINVRNQLDEILKSHPTEFINTDLIPSSVLCIGYPKQDKFPKPRRNLKEIVHAV